MRLYRILDTGWAGTQADAKARAKEAGRPWHERDVPTDKPGLIAFLDERNVPGDADERRQVAQLMVPLERDPMDVAPTTPAPAAADPDRVRRRFTADEIAAFILDQAEIYQVENIMAAIGTRFAELAKQRRAA